MDIYDKYIKHGKKNPEEYCITFPRKEFENPTRCENYNKSMVELVKNKDNLFNIKTLPAEDVEIYENEIDIYFHPTRQGDGIYS